MSIKFSQLIILEIFKRIVLYKNKNMKIKKQKNIFIGLLVFCLISTYIFLPPVFNANAIDSISVASDLMSDSDPQFDSTHTFTFTTGTSTLDTGFVRVVFDSDFTNISNGNVTCMYGDANWTASTTGNTVDCTPTVTEVGTTTQIVVTNVTNPSTEGTRFNNIYVYETDDVIRERVTVTVAVIEDVLMTATVDSTLLFTISGTTTAASVNGVACTEDSTATTTPFGTLPLGTPQTVCQDLSVASNAVNGFAVTVWADGELTSNGGANINSFNNSPTGFGSSTVGLMSDWASPLGILDNYNTYGHMGLTSEDDTLNWGGGDPFDNAGLLANYAGFNGQDPIEVMWHDGPTIGAAANKGYTSVAYTAEIMSLQEAGDYEATLTYVCTPIY